MPEVIQYFLKLSVSITAVYSFYWLVLRKLTFYNWNRWYLLIYSLLCFYIASADISPMLEKNALAQNTVIGFIPVVDLYAKADKGFFANFDSWDWVSLFFYGGIVLMVGRLMLQYISFYRLKKSAKLLSDKPVKLYQVDKAIIPFSFGNSIFINQQQHSESELKEIIRHEFIHVKQQHSVDVLVGEIVCLLNWYNPFAWMMRKAIRQNLEFIADRQVLNHGLDRKQYQYLLLKVVGVSAYSVGNQFNFSSLKKRIMMMNKIRTARVHLIKFLFILPMVAILLVSFRKNIEQLMVHDLVLKPDGSGQFADLEFSTKTAPIHGSAADRKSTNVHLNDTLLTIEGQHLPENYLVAVDGRLTKKEVLKTLDPSGVSDIQFMIGKEALHYGSLAAERGVLAITTSQNSRVNQLKRDTVPQSKKATVTVNDLILTADSIHITNDESAKFDASLDGPKPNGIRIRGYGVPSREPLYVIDGEIQNSAYDINKLKGDDIQTITVLKEQQAMNLYGGRAVNGALVITTKSGTLPTSSWKKDEPVKVNENFSGIYIIDGKQYSNAAMRELNINPNDIESINVWKDVSAVNMFGERGRNGVIEIFLKKGARLGEVSVVMTDKKREELFEQARRERVLFIGESNPVKIDVEGVPQKDLVLFMQDASVQTVNGVFNIVPRTQRDNVELKVYRKKSNGDLQLIQTYKYRTDYMPITTKIK